MTTYKAKDGENLEKSKSSNDMELNDSYNEDAGGEKSGRRLLIKYVRRIFFAMIKC